MKQSELLRHIADNIDNKKGWHHGLRCEDGLSWFAVMDRPERITLKPRTHTVNGFEVPAPMDVETEDYFLAGIENPDGVVIIEWSDCPMDRHCLKHGLCFATREHAELNRNAQLGIDPYGEGELWNKQKKT